MTIEPVNSVNFSFAFSGGISKKHSEIIVQLLALGIQPSYNYAIDKAKLNAAQSKKVAKILHKDKIKEETGLDANISKKADKDKNNTIKEQMIDNFQPRIDFEFAGAMYIASINKAFIEKTKQQTKNELHKK